MWKYHRAKAASSLLAFGDSSHREWDPSSPIAPTPNKLCVHACRHIAGVGGKEGPLRIPFAAAATCIWGLGTELRLVLAPPADPANWLVSKTFHPNRPALRLSQPINPTGRGVCAAMVAVLFLSSLRFGTSLLSVFQIRVDTRNQSHQVPSFSFFVHWACEPVSRPGGRGSGSDTVTQLFLGGGNDGLSCW